LAQRSFTEKEGGVISTGGLTRMVRCSIAINTRQQHCAVRTTLFTEQNKVEGAQSLSGLTVPKWTPVSLRLNLNDLNAKLYSNKIRQLRYFGM